MIRNYIRHQEREDKRLDQLSLMSGREVGPIGAARDRLRSHNAALSGSHVLRKPAALPGKPSLCKWVPFLCPFGDGLRCGGSRLLLGYQRASGFLFLTDLTFRFPERIESLGVEWV